MIDEQQADAAGDEAVLQLTRAEGGGDGVAALHLEADRQGAELQLLRERGRRRLGEVAGDLGLAVGDRRVHLRGGDDLAVEHDSELVARRIQRDDAGGDRGELRRCPRR